MTMACQTRQSLKQGCQRALLRTPASWNILLINGGMVYDAQDPQLKLSFRLKMIFLA